MNAAAMTAVVDPTVAGPAATKRRHPAHLNPLAWEHANRWLVRKALAEFAHERLITPVPLGDGRYAVRSRSGATYAFSARELPLEHWLIDAESIQRVGADGAVLDLDGLELFVELRDDLDLGPQVLPLLLEEVSATLSAQAFRLSRWQPSSRELVGADFQQIESAMSEGHPCFVANSGRIGFDADEYLRYAPEAGEALHLVWLAARRERSTFATTRDLSVTDVLENEFDQATLERFAAVLGQRGLTLEDVHLLPVHPWQWDNRVTTTFAADLARGDLIFFGEGEELHRPQQSIRTFFNVSAPGRSYVKTALSVLNMGFLRGLSAAYMKVTPAINDFIADIVRGDETLRSVGFDVLREHASVGYHSPTYEAVADKGDPHLKMLAGLWRESPMSHLGEGETLATMASLLHRDDDGVAYAAELIEASGLTPAQWVRDYLQAYLVPVVHMLMAHQVAFMPHGENVILVLRDGAVQRVLMKDIGEEVVLFDTAAAVPPGVERIQVAADGPTQALSVLTDVVDCFLRFLAAILDDADVMPSADFWQIAREVLDDYESAHPDLAQRFTEVDLRANEFTLSCLNRLQLRNNQQMVDLADPVGGLAFVGTLVNPLATPAAATQGVEEETQRSG